MKEKLLISACLCGQNTKYNGGNNNLKNLELLEQKFILIPICPEVMGGLSTPRDPSEKQEKRVVSNKGKDVTKEFELGAFKALKIAKENGVTLALLKESSPSCGSHLIYDGSFSGTKIEGEGITAKLLRENQIKIYSENQIDELLDLQEHNI